MNPLFPERLKTLRKRKRISQEELGSLMGVSGVAVHKWETSQSEPNLESLQKLAVFFGVSLDELCGTGAYKPASADNVTMLTRAFRQLTAEEQTKLLNVGKALFAHAFSFDEQR